MEIINYLKDETLVPDISKVNVPEEIQSAVIRILQKRKETKNEKKDQVDFEL